jgi:flavin-dependent dehydrogenase
VTLKHPKALYQVVILGGGPAGSACAISLARQGIQEILLVEAGEYDQFCIGESIPPETRLVFIRLGILEQFLAEGHEPCYGSRCYWGDDRWGSDDTPLGVYGHGWHLDRSRFNRFVAQQAEIAGASLMTGTTFQQCQKF